MRAIDFFNDLALRVCAGKWIRGVGSDSRRASILSEELSFCCWSVEHRHFEVAQQFMVKLPLWRGAGRTHRLPVCEYCGNNSKVMEQVAYQILTPERMNPMVRVGSNTRAHRSRWRDLPNRPWLTVYRHVVLALVFCLRFERLVVAHSHHMTYRQSRFAESVSEYFAIVHKRNSSLETLVAGK